MKGSVRRWLAAIALCVPPLVQADIIIGSWNIQNLGWNNDKRFDKVAHVANHFDIVAIQELMNEAALGKHCINRRAG